MKCLFLRMRNPPSITFDEMITKVFAININSKEGKDLLSRTKSTFGDFRNKYNDAVEKFIKDYKEQRYSSYFFIFLLI
jgi:hypothetical protein